MMAARSWSAPLRCLQVREQVRAQVSIRVSRTVSTPLPLTCSLVSPHPASHCSVNYLDVPGTVRAQRVAVLAAIAARPAARTTYDAAAVVALRAASATAASTTTTNPRSLRDLVAAIPGIREAGWDAARIQLRDALPDREALATGQLSAFIEALLAHDDSWPFREPVDITVVPDYVEVVKSPIGTTNACGVTLRMTLPVGVFSDCSSWTCTNCCHPMTPTCPLAP